MKLVKILIIGMLFLQNFIILQSLAEEFYFNKNDWDIIVPDDYLTIQDAINNSNINDRIFVRDGIYQENIIVDKNGLLIQGENKFKTILDGSKIKDTVNIESPNVTIQGFTITNGWNEDKTLWDLSGIRVSSSNVAIMGNRINSNRLGVNVLTLVSNITITDNQFIDDSIIIGNYVYSCKSKKEDFIHNINNNTVNGKPLYYFKNKCDFTLPNDAGQVILGNCSNITIKNMYFSHADFPIILGFCSNCTIENIRAEDT